MKNRFIIPGTLLPLLLFFPFSSFSQSSVWHLGIAQTNIALDAGPVVVGEITIHPDVAGKVVVHFDGKCISDVGDRIVLAASNQPDWSVNDGNCNVEAVSADNNTLSFSHTRSYDVLAGIQTFYAVAHNYVETDGNGMASIYGSLTVEFIPAGSGQITQTVGIIKPDQDLNTDPVVLAQITVNAPVAGNVLVHFDGTCVSSVGDLIVLAASDQPDWSVNDGNIGVEAYDLDYNRNTFAHSRAYPVGSGNHTFYAVAQNFVETSGNGIASVYGTLRVDFIPGMSPHIVSFTGINNTGLYLEGSPVVLAETTINPTEAGKVKVRFDGMCYADVGDRIVLAASNGPNWGINDGSVSVEAIDSDIDNHCFSHTRVYDVVAGPQTFYAVGQNYVETDGDGFASIYGSLTVEFFPESISGSEEPVAKSQALELFPNPTAGQLTISLPGTFHSADVQVADVLGRVLRTWPCQAVLGGKLTLDVSGLAKGNYFLTLSDQKQLFHASFQKE